MIITFFYSFNIIESNVRIYISIWRCQIFTYYPIVPHCGVVSDLCAFQAETDSFPQHMFKETFLEKVEPHVWWLCIKMTYKDVNPELCELALLLHQPASSASIERILVSFTNSEID